MPLRSAITSLFLGDPERPRAAAPNDRVLVVHQPEPTGDSRSVLMQVESQLANQADVSLRLGELVRQLDGTLSALPEMLRQQDRLIGTIIDQANRAKDRDDAMRRGMDHLRKGTDAQVEVLSLVQQQLDLNHESSRRVGDILGEARTALGAFAATSERHARGIESLADATRRRTTQSDRLERRLQLWLIVTTALCTMALVQSFVVALRDEPQAQVVPTVEQPNTDGSPAIPAVSGQPADAGGHGVAATQHSSAPTAGTTSAEGSPSSTALKAPSTTHTPPPVTASPVKPVVEPVADPTTEPAADPPVAPGAVRGSGFSEPSARPE